MSSEGPPAVARCGPSLEGVAFRGWPAEAVEFYEGLEADNSKQYWQQHKAGYEEHVLAPMQELLNDLASEFGAGRVFRPYRDVRFSTDKSPYKTQIAATLERGGYVQFSADGLAAGCGMYALAADQLDRFRRSIADELRGADLVRRLEPLRHAGAELAAHDRLKSAPRGYAKDHPRIDLLRLKGLVAWRQWPPEAGAELEQPSSLVATFFRACAPLQAWLAEHVGESQLEARRR